MAGYGPPMTDRVIVGEAPGEREVVEGKPFVGKAGIGSTKPSTPPESIVWPSTSRTRFCATPPGTRGRHPKRSMPVTND